MKEADILLKDKAGQQNDDVVNDLELGVGAAKGIFATVGALKACVGVLRQTFITVPKATGGTALKALISSSTATNIRMLGSMTAGLGIALDAVTLVNSAHSLATNERHEYAVHLETVAEELHEEMDNAMEALEKKKKEVAEE
ncbi:hypothetical protein PFISCL1PPCAC_5418 [Pristionchus fissidentatus]|uniref:Uncharacterized protein n=1 Tax=Pristionchus fissidentatus TaxID=1538716 RepID=A0AAV5V5U8_9BILA|nr:hypothetical protein PFISCL1PPCAC_5418 [Pristionchus fissidentatus]